MEDIEIKLKLNGERIYAKRAVSNLANVDYVIPVIVDTLCGIGYNRENIINAMSKCIEHFKEYGI